MILGQDRAGKTSLKKSLLGMPFNPEEESTVGVEVDPSKFEVEVDQVKNWQRTDQTKLDVSQFVEDIARIVAKDLKETDVDQKNTGDVDSLSEQVILYFSVRSFQSICAPQGNSIELVSVGRAPDGRAGGLRFEPQTGPTLRVLK